MTDFKIASAFVEVDLKDRTPQQEAELRRRLERGGPVNLDTALKDPKNSEAIRKAIEAGPAAKIRAEVDTDTSSIGKSKASAHKAGQELGSTIGDGMAEGVRRNSKKVDDAFGSVAKRANAQFKAMEFGAYFAGLPIAAAAAGAGVGVALGGIPLLFAGIAAAAAQSNPKVADSFNDLADHVVTSVQAMAKPLEDDLIVATDKLGASFDRLSPQIAGAMEASADAIDPLIDGVTGLAERAMPGLTRAIEASDAPMRGWESLLKSSGSGVTDFFDNLIEGAEGSEEILKTLGHMIQDALGAAGEVIGNLSENGGPALEDFRGSLQSVYDLLESATDQGSAVYEFFSGFSGAVTLVTGALSGLNSILGGVLGPFASLLGMYKALNLMSFGKLGDAIGDVGKKSKGSTTELDGFGGGLLRSAKGAGVAAVAAVGLEFVMSQVQQRAREGAKQLDEHRDAVDAVATAYRASGGTFDDYAASQLRTTDLWKLASGNARALGLDINEMTTAVGKGGADWETFGDKSSSALNALLSKSGDTSHSMTVLRAAVDSFAASGGSASQLEWYIDSVAKSFQESTGATDAQTEAYRQQLIAGFNLQGQMNSLKGSVEEARAQFEKDAEARKSISTESANAAQAVRELGAAYEVIGDAAASSEDKAAAFLDVLEKLKDTDFSQEASFKGINDTLREFEKGVGGLSDKLIKANGSIDTTSASGSKLFDVVTNLQSGFANAGMSINDLLQAGVPLGQAISQTNNDLVTARERFIQMADAQGMSREAAEKLADRYGLSSEALGQWMHQQNEASLAAEGITKRVDELGNEIYTLPDGKTITFTAETDPARNAFYGLKSDLEKTQFVAQLTANAAAAYQEKDGFWGSVTAAPAVAGLDADPSGAYGALGGWLGAGNSAVAIGTQGANAAPAFAALGGWLGAGNSALAVGTQGANNDPALQALAYWSALTRATVAMAKIGANTAPASATWGAWQPASKVANIFAKIWGGAATGGEIRGYADGGPVQNFDGGGPVSGPGTGTSDSIPAMLSNGEIVIKEKEAQEDRAGLLALNAGVPPEQAFGLNLGDGKGAATGSGGITIENMHVTIDAKSVAQMQSVQDFFDRIIPAARQGASTLAGVK